MEYLRTGVILNTENYEACVSFYSDILGLKQLFAVAEYGQNLTCFEFGGAYLMVETGGYAKAGGKSIEENCTKLRLNVRSLEDIRKYLRSRGIEAEISRFERGSTINIYDPDGNRIGIREDRAFTGRVQP